MIKGTIELLGMKFHAFHGCLPQERLCGSDFLVDFSCSCDISAPAASDRLEDTYDCAEIFALVKEQMEIPSNLLENVAARIAESIAAKFPSIEHLSVRVCKLNPPVAGTCGMSAVTIEK